MTSGLPLSARVPTESAMRRAQRRARHGASLDASEATVLLHARGEHLGDLLASAARVRDAGLVAAGRLLQESALSRSLIAVSANGRVNFRCGSL